MTTRYKVTKHRRSYPGNIHPLNYPKDETVVAPNKFGIFVYRRRKDAEGYLQHSIENAGYTEEEVLKAFQILRVETIGKGRKLTLCPTAEQLDRDTKIDEILRLSKKIGYRSLNEAENINRFDEITVWLCAPGTMTYPGVKVLT